MSVAEAVRREWARRVAEAYDGWPTWVPSDGTSPGWFWGIPQAELEDVDRRLRQEQQTGETARALRDERSFWGLESEGD